MKLLVLAQNSPFHHGQGCMVQLLLDGLKGSAVRVFDVNAGLADDFEAAGRMRWAKGFLLLKHCAQAIWLRLWHGVDHLYYVTACGDRAPLYRDWVVMLLCRPFFRRLVYHWHAAGLGEWLEKSAKPWERWLSERLIYGPDLSIVPGNYNRRDADAVASRKVAIVPNGIPDPRPDFEKDVLPVRLAQAEKRRSGESYTCQVLYLGLCSRSKGLFDLLEAIAMANEKLQGTPVRMKLLVAAGFNAKPERAEFDKRVSQPDLVNWVEYKGFVNSDERRGLLRTSDCLCFPTHYEAESFGLEVVEAMAYGLPVVVTNWRSVPEVLPDGYEYVVEPQSPAALAKALIALLGEGYDPRLREQFVQHYTDELFIAKIRAALMNL